MLGDDRNRIANLTTQLRGSVGVPSDRAESLMLEAAPAVTERFYIHFVRNIKP